MTAIKTHKLLVQLLFSFLILLTSCNTFKRSTLFEGQSPNTSAFEQTLLKMNKSYLIQKTDVLAISAFPNRGEQLIDPTGDFPTGGGGGSVGGGGTIAAGGVANNANAARFPISTNGATPQTYTVDSNGEVNIPRLGYIKLEGLTLLQADSLLTIRFSEYMKEPYVITQYLNKKVIIMGALGDRIIPLNQENMSLFEVLAQSAPPIQGGGMNIQSNLRDARVDNIKIIRNYETGNMSVLNVDLSTLEGTMQLQTNIQPDDIIYIKPRRNFDGSTFSDVTGVISPIASIAAFIFTLIALGR